MPSRTYAQISCSLKGSKKIRGLSSHKTRWAYTCVHLSDYCTYTGLFRYPQHVWAHDAQMTLEEISDSISELTESGLIEFDTEDDFIRIVGWFHKRSGPDNPNRVESIINDLSGMDDVDPVMFCNSVAELTASSVKRSLRWERDGIAQAKLYGSLKQFLSEVFQDHGDQFLSAMNDDLAGMSSTVGTEIRAIFPPPRSVGFEGFGKGYPNPSGTRDETRRKRDGN